jgi:2-phospho-L-lactate guanylyltransferase
MSQPLALVPLKGWVEGKQRLAGALPDDLRHRLAVATAGMVVNSFEESGFAVAVVTSDPAVTAWAEEHRIGTIPDAGHGLDAAATDAVAAAAGRPWCLVHGDLPLIDVADTDALRAALDAGETALAPSRDGGTNAIASTGGFRFRFGPGSFHRHLASAGERVRVLVSVGLALEVDTPADLAAAASLPRGRWLRGFVA